MSSAGGRYQPPAGFGSGSCNQSESVAFITEMRIWPDLYAQRMDVQLSQLRALVAVHRMGTFTDAAAELGVSQAAVSRSIAGLEAAVGVRVFHRTTRQVSLTKTGALILASAQRVLDEVNHLRRIATGPGRELRIGYAWGALGKHTRTLQRQWSAAHPDLPLVFVQSNTPTAGLSEGIADLAIARKPLLDNRFETTLIGVEARYAALPTDDALARRRTLRLRDLSTRTIAIDSLTGTTTPELLQPLGAPTAIRSARGVDEWLTLIAAGQAVGITSEATANQNPRPGVAYRALRDAPPIAVSLVWWKDEPPQLLDDLLALACAAFQGKKQPPPT
jgi:DNA-binding transcriptional LysR family regulator